MAHRAQLRRSSPLQIILLTIGEAPVRKLTVAPRATSGSRSHLYTQMLPIWLIVYPVVIGISVLQSRAAPRLGAMAPFPQKYIFNLSSTLYIGLDYFWPSFHAMDQWIYICLSSTPYFVSRQSESDSVPVPLFCTKIWPRERADGILFR